MKEAKLIVYRDTAATYGVGDLFTIGRNPLCNLFLDAQGVSRVHATLVKDVCGDTHLIHDGGLNPKRPSTNGILIRPKGSPNWERKTVHLLQDEDCILIAKFSMQYLCREPEDEDESKKTFPGDGNTAWTG